MQIITFLELAALLLKLYLVLEFGLYVASCTKTDLCLQGHLVVLTKIRVGIPLMPQYEC
jgi:hypothetical protein